MAFAPRRQYTQHQLLAQEAQKILHERALHVEGSTATTEHRHSGAGDAEHAALVHPSPSSKASSCAQELDAACQPPPSFPHQNRCSRRQSARSRGKSRTQSHASQGTNSTASEAAPTLSKKEEHSLIQRLYSSTAGRSYNAAHSNHTSSQDDDELTLQPQLHRRTVELAQEITDRSQRIETLYEHGVEALRSHRQPSSASSPPLPHTTSRGSERLLALAQHMHHSSAAFDARMQDDSSAPTQRAPSSHQQHVVMSNSISLHQDDDQRRSSEDRSSNGAPTQTQQHTDARKHIADSERTYRRLTAWAEEKKQWLEQKRKKREEEEYHECTFQPYVSNTFPREALEPTPLKQQRQRSKSTGRSRPTGSEGSGSGRFDHPLYAISNGTSPVGYSGSPGFDNTASISSARSTASHERRQRPKSAGSVRSEMTTLTTSAETMEQKHKERIQIARDMRRERERRLSRYDGSSWKAGTTKPDAAPRCATPGRSRSTTPDRSRPTTPRGRSEKERSAAAWDGEAAAERLSGSVLDAASLYV